MFEGHRLIPANNREDSGARLRSALLQRLLPLLTGVVPHAELEAEEIVEASLASAGKETDPDAVESAALALAARRTAGEPLAHLLGRARFMGLTLDVTPGVLAPREETEVLGETGLQLLEARSRDGSGLLLGDLCCGSGNLACGIAARLPRLHAFAADLTPQAVELARRNVQKLKLDDRVDVRCGDLFGAVESLGLERRFDVIVCNPPYISSGRLAKDRAELLLYEPREAFDGGAYGLAIHQRLVRESARFLRSGGALAFEFGLGQQAQVQRLFERSEAFAPPEFRNDKQGNPKVALARLRG